MKADRVLADADAAVRRDYELRAAQSEPGLPPAPEPPQIPEHAAPSIGMPGAGTPGARHARRTGPQRAPPAPNEPLARRRFRTAGTSVATPGAAQPRLGRATPRSVAPISGP